LGHGFHPQRIAIRAHDAGVGSVDISPDGRRLVSGGEHRLVKVWDATTGAQVLELAGHTAPVQVVAYSPAGTRIASASGSFDGGAGLTPGEAKVWEADSGRLLFTVAGTAKGFNCVAFSPDGKRLACGGGGVVALVDAQTGEQLLSIRAHDDSVVGLAFSPDGRGLASASYDKTVKVWDVADGTPLVTFRGHTQRVTCVAFSPDGRRLASGSDDQTVRVFAATSGDEALSLKGHLGPVHSLAFSISWSAGVGTMCCGSGMHGRCPSRPRRRLREASRSGNVGVVRLAVGPRLPWKGGGFGSERLGPAGCRPGRESGGMSSR
jgi:WD40 repeat protein